MATVWFCEPAEKELKRFARDDKNNIAIAVSYLEDDIYRKQNKLDLNLIEEGFQIYSLIIGNVWLGFHEGDDGDVWVDWVSLRSRFRM